MDVTVDNSTAREASIEGVPLSSFTCWQHGCVDIVTLSRVATFMRRGCFQKGFIASDFFKYRADIKVLPSAVTSGKEDATATSSDQTTSAKPNRFFVISCDIVLDKDCPNDPIIMYDIADGHLTVSSVSNSTFSLYLDVGVKRPYGAKKAKSGEKNIEKCGYVHITYVCISDETRRSIPIDAHRKQQVTQVLRTDLGVAKMQRLTRPVAPDLTSHGAEITTGAEAPPVSPMTHGVPKSLLFRHQIPLRDADTDFNGHLNQSMYIAFVVDAIKAFMRMKERKALLNSGNNEEAMQKELHHGFDDDVDKPNDFTAVKPLQADATTSKVVRRFRIDYVKEVPSREAVLMVHLHHMPEENPVAAGGESMHVLWFDVVAYVPEDLTEEELAATSFSANFSEHINTLNVLQPKQRNYKKPFLAAQGLVDVSSKWL